MHVIVMKGIMHSYSLMEHGVSHYSLTDAKIVGKKNGTIVGFGGKAPSRRRHGGVGAEPPALKNFAFFLQK